MHPATQGPHTPTEIPLSTPSLASPSTPHREDSYLQTPASKAGQGRNVSVRIEGDEMEIEDGEGLGYGKVGPKVQVEEGYPDVERLREMKRRLEKMEGDGELKQMVRSLLTLCMEDLPFLQQQLAAQRDTIRTMQQQARLAERFMAIERERLSAERQSWHTSTQALLKQKDADIAAGVRPKKLLDLDVGYHQELEAANKRLEMDNRLMAPRLADTQRQINKLVTELQHLRSHVVLSSHHFDGETPLNAILPQHPPAQGAAGPSREQPILQSLRRSRSPAIVFRSTTMGDARTEHLLLAARKVRTMRQSDDRVGRLTLEELRQGGVIGPDGGIGYSEGYGGIMVEEEEDADAEESELDEKPVISERRAIISGKGKGKMTATPLVDKKKGMRPLTTPGAQKSSRQPLTTPGGSNFNDLLRAAELATRPITPTPGAQRQAVPMSAMSAARNVMRDETPGSVSPTKKATRWEQKTEKGFTDAEAEAEDENTALDLLLQASQIDSPDEDGKQEGKKQKPKEKESPKQPSGLGLAPPLELRKTPQPIVDHMIDPSLTDPAARTTINTLSTPYTAPSTSTTAPMATPRQRPRNISNASASLAEVTTPARNWALYQDSPFDAGSSPPIAKRERFGSISATPLLEAGEGNAFNSPTGGTVPGLGKYVHLTSSMPARRIRSPYLKWTVEEDELLARAVAMHGEKWDLVSKGVPTRSYHQVRQRWLRKTGAFDKKPTAAELGMDEGDRDRAASPTPLGGQGAGKVGEGGKKRKMS